MLNRVSLFYSILIITFFLSCKKEGEELIATKLFMDASKNIAKDQYYSVYNMANDSVKIWLDYELPIYIGHDPWQIDSLLCFNKSNNRCVMAILVKCIQQDCVQDMLRFFHGAKIGGQWYFFLGATVTLPRELYQDNIHTPLSFAKMHEIAIREIFSGYLINDERGGGQINEKFFESMANKNRSGRGYGGCFECKNEEEYYLHLVRRNWKGKRKRFEPT